MKVAIFGSCVSRDTCEYMPEAEVVAYVARHSATSLVSPHGTNGLDISTLNSPFQRRMVNSDLKGNGIRTVSKNAKALDLVLVDLVDERRGYWLFPNGTSMTNSLEVEACRASAQAADKGARLVAFGTDEHFQRWLRGFNTLIAGLRERDLLERTLFLDVEWAGALAGAPHPQGDLLSKLGRRWRKLQRGTRDAGRTVANGATATAAWDRMRSVKPTEAEEFADRANRANANYMRYRKVVSSAIPAVVTRSSGEVRIGPEHKWGPQPFHYRDEDYLSIVGSISKRMKEIGGDH